MKTIYKLCCFLTALILACNAGTVSAQGTPTRVIVQGKVIDSKTKETIIGASVVELDKDKRTIRGVSTDINGNYALQVSSLTNTIQVTYISYTTIVQNIANRTQINFSLVPVSNELAQVVITGSRPVNNGTGLNIDARNSTLATATIQAKDLEDLSATSIDQALQGRLPGVDIATTSGNPGAGMSIRIRGTSNLNGSAEPLIVLDGIPYETQIPTDFNFSTADEQGYAQLLNIAPADIKDITVLKDAASTAVWGSRAANGVLIITTKRGVIGKPIVSYNLQVTRQKQPENIPLLSGDQYSNLIPEQFNNTNSPIPITTPEFLYDPLQPFTFYNYNRNSNWIDAITQIGLIQTHNISLQGGGEKARYYASVGYTNNKGTTIGTDLNRITTKINLDYNVSNRIKFLSDFTYTNINNNNNYSNPRGVAYSKMPNMAVYQYDEYGNQTPNYFSPISNIQGAYPSTYNPLALATLASSKQYGQRITPHFRLQYDIKPGVLIATYDVQFDINNNKIKNFLPSLATGRPVTETVSNRATDNDGDSYAVDNKVNIVFSPDLGEKTSLQSLLSFQTNDNQNNSQSITTSNTASSFLQDPSSPGRTQNADLTLTANFSQQRRVGLVTTNQISFFDQRYIINVGGRLDGNSRLAANNRFGFFPSLSTLWRLSDEPFMKKFTFIDDLRIRGSYGHSGQEPGGNYGFYNTYNPNNTSYLGQTGVVPGNIGLDNLVYQVTIGRNAGFNVSMFKNRFRVDVDFYSNKIKDLIFNNLVIPNYTGYTRITSNVGVMVNQGFEVGLNTVPYRSKNLVVNFDFNVSQNNNVIQEVSEYYPRTDGRALNQNGVYRSYLQIGNPFGSFYGFKFNGVYTDRDATVAKDRDGNKIVGPNGQIIYMRFGYPTIDYTFQPGDSMYEDVNKDGNINEDDVVYLGNGTPKISGGFGPSLTYKGNFKLQSYFTFKSGYQLINETLMNTTNMYTFNNQSTLVLQRWRNPGDVTNVPRALYRSGFNWLGSDRYVSDASFVRLRSVTASYSLNRSLLDKLKVKSASFNVTLENLYTWTNYKGVDPDVGSNGPNNPFSYVTDKALTPPSKNILMGFRVGF